MNDLELQKILENRHSGRVYNSNKNLTRSQLRELIHAAHLSPSCYNEQPWHYVIGIKETNPEGYNKILSSLVEINQAWAKEAPVLIAIVSSEVFRKNQKPNRWGHYDTGASAMAMVATAQAMGLMAHQMGGFDPQKIQEAFNIPKEYTPIAVMALGYEKEGEPIPPKDRRDPKLHFYDGAWDTPFE